MRVCVPVHLEDVDGLLLHGEHSQDVPVEVEALVVRQDDLVTLEGARVTQAPRVQVDDVQGVVLQGRARVGRHRLVVAVHLARGGGDGLSGTPHHHGPGDKGPMMVPDSQTSTAGFGSQQ